MTQTISSAIATRDQQRQQATGAAALVEQYSHELTSVLPPQLTAQAQAWLATSISALRTGKIVRGPNGGKMYELEVAALNNPHAYLRALREAARNGLQPGTPEYYLTPRMNGGKLEILGIIGYQGYIEQMFRAGYVTAVVTDVVRENDPFQFVRGVNEIPIHPIDWKASAKDRGDLVLAYAYAKMIGGGYSDVIIVNQDDIDDAKKNSAGSESKYSPWVNFPKAMWKKTAVRKLKAFVPTSSVDQRALQVAAEVIQASVIQAQRVQQAPVEPPPSRAALEQGVIEGDVSGELADHQPDPDEADIPSPTLPTPPESTPDPRTAAEPDPPGSPRSTGQARALTSLFRQKNVAEADRGAFAEAALSRPVPDLNALSAAEADALIEFLRTSPGPVDHEAR